MHINFVQEDKKQHTFEELFAGEVFIDPKTETMWIKTNDSISAVCLNNGELSKWEDDEPVIPVDEITVNYKL